MHPPLLTHTHQIAGYRILKLFLPRIRIPEVSFGGVVSRIHRDASNLSDYTMFGLLYLTGVAPHPQSKNADRP